MTVTIDDELVAQAQEALGAATKAEAIRMALREAIRRKQLQKVLEDQGKIELDLDQEKLRRLRQKR